MPLNPKIGQGQSHIPAPAEGASIRIPLVVSASTTSGVIGYARNPEAEAVIAQITRLHVRTQSTGACTLDIGTATTNVTNDGLIDGISVNSAANTVYDNITDHGTNGKTRQYVAPGSFITASVSSGDANGLVADLYVNYQILDGGSPRL